MTHNEVLTLPRLLESLGSYRKAGGEVVIMDASDDDTPRVARDAGCVVVDEPKKLAVTITPALAKELNKRFVFASEDPIARRHDRVFDLAKARNYAATLAAHDTVFMPDADETVTAFNLQRIEREVADGAGIFEYMFVHSHDELKQASCKFVHSRFYDRRQFRWDPCCPVHEALEPMPGENGKHVCLPEQDLLLEHWQNKQRPSTSALTGLAWACHQYPTHARNRHYFARELMYGQRYRSAIAQFEAHVEMETWLAEASQSWIYMGDCYGQLGEAARQLECYHKAFLVDGNRREPLLRLASHYYAANDAQRTAAYAAAALTIPWRNGYNNIADYYREMPHEMLYWSLWQLGDRDGARRHWQQAVNFRPFSPKYQAETKWFGGGYAMPAPEIQGWMLPSELDWLHSAAKEAQTVVELGSWRGRSTHALCSGCPGTVTAIDHWQGSRGFAFEEAEHAIACADDAVYNDFARNTAGFANLRVMRGDANAAADAFADRSIDLLFIDAEHTYEGVIENLIRWARKVKVGGTLAGHDYCRDWPSVCKAVDDAVGAVEVHGTIWSTKITAVAPLYPVLDVQVTLRCNSACANCIKLCNMEDATGLDYRDTDMPLERVRWLRAELEDLYGRTGAPAVGTLCLTGGEPTVHPDLAEIVRILEPLVAEGVIGKLEVNSNLHQEACAEAKPYLRNWSTVEQKPGIHNTVLLHPSEISDQVNTFAKCGHYRKWRPVANVYGYSMCCAADGYIRLFGLDELVIPQLPENVSGFPLDKMDAVCRHCPFGCATEVFERDAGRPVSAIYAEQADRNRAKQPCCAGA